MRKFLIRCGYVSLALFWASLTLDLGAGFVLSGYISVTARILSEPRSAAAVAIVCWLVVSFLLVQLDREEW